MHVNIKTGNMTVRVKLQKQIGVIVNVVSTVGPVTEILLCPTGMSVTRPEIFPYEQASSVTGIKKKFKYACISVEGGRD